MKKALLTMTIFVSSAFLVSAQINVGGGGVPSSGSDFSNLDALFKLLQEVLDLLAPIMVGLAVLAFFYFLTTFIIKGGEDGAKRQESLKGMGWSIIALLVMVSIWGILSFFNRTTGIEAGGELQKIKLPGQK